MAPKRGIPFAKNGSKGVRFTVLRFVLLCVLTPVVFFLSRGSHVADQNDISAVPDTQHVAKWREWNALQDLKSHFSKEVFDVIVSSTDDMGPLSLDNFRKNMSASWRVVGLETSNVAYELKQPTTHVRQEKLKVKEERSSEGLAQWTDSPALQARRKLIEKRRVKRASELVKMDNEVIVKLENSAIEHSRSVESAVLDHYG
ncbi:unnamed protein product [Vicia faba]|uniref:Uncharacterized protein n=1 Tax=Vicia faba TaxID=3906 RepID=A0AAV1AAB2_VICFA|nr:unnamed protein product [Vicia faba]